MRFLWAFRYNPIAPHGLATAHGGINTAVGGLKPPMVPGNFFDGAF
ncbi:MAG: hypothetical protein LBK44_03645 [Spirochaetales bacterium]|jgi:hypothetical protein|nr:hypothetical protein [Spirochaetales bacterium]